MIVDHFKDKIPSILKSERRWINWRYEDRDGKPTKVPYCPWEDSGPPERADSTNPNTWGTYEQAVDTGAKYGFGIGFVLGGGYCGIDLDDVRSADGVFVPWAQDIIGAIHSYSDVSPSKTGGKIICKAKKPGKRCRTKALPGFEIYDSGRFFTLTGHHIDGTPATVEARQEQIETLYWIIFKGGPDEDPPEPVTRRLSITLEDAEIIKLASGAKNSDKFKKLYRGDNADLVTLGYRKEDGSADHSSADQALVHILDWWTNSNLEQIDHLFRSSGLMRDKWEREDYRRRTIGNSVDRMIDRYVAPEPTITPEQESKLEAIVKPANMTDLSRLPETMIESAADPAAALPGLPQDTPAKTEFVPNYFKSGVETPKPKLLRWSELKRIAAKQEDKWIIRDIVEPGTLTIFSGLPYSGKTTVLAQLMACIASGNDFLAHKVETVCPMIFVNADRFRERLVVKRIMRALSNPLDELKFEERWFTVDVAEIPITLTTKYIVSLIEAVQPFMLSETGLLVIDTLRSGFLQECESGGENDPVTMTRVLSPLRKLSRLTNWAIILPHHNNRGRDEYAGTAAIAGSTDALWSISREDDSLTADLRIRTRDGILPTITVKETEDGLTTTEKLYGMPVTPETAMSVKEICNLTGWKQSTAYYNLGKDKRVKTVEDKKGKRYYWPGS